MTTEMPPIYLCVSLEHEHEHLKSKISSLKEEISRLKRTQPDQRTCSISCQTTRLRSPSPPPSRPVPRDEEVRLRRLIDAQNELLKKYEEDARPPSSEFIDDYRRRIHRYEDEKRRAIDRRTRAEHRRDKVQKRFDELREKLRPFDREFFTEVNDLKFALQQSIHLNREYEKTIQMLSEQLGIAYPINDQ